MNQKVCAIIPALNEEKTVAEVVHIVASSQMVDELIVVSDGSTDSTVEEAKRAGAKVFARPRQHGKGQALLYAVSKTDADVLVFFDADLMGLTSDHVERLLLPVLSGARVMNIGLRDRGTFYTRIAHRLPLISGERALLREVFVHVPPEFMQGYMIETALNYFCRVHRLAYGAVVLSGLHIRRKYQKVGYVRGVIEYVRMAFEVMQAHLAIRIAKLLGKF